MNLILSGRGVELDDSLREYATEKLTRSQRFFDRIIKMEVELRHERNPRVKEPDSVEVTVKTPGDTLRVHAQGADHFAAIDVAADRLDVQIKKIKGRFLRRHHDGAGVPLAATPDDDDEDVSPQIVRMRPAFAKPLTPEEARMELEDRGLRFVMFTNAESMQAAVLYKRDDGDLGLIEHGS